MKRHTIPWAHHVCRNAPQLTKGTPLNAKPQEHTISILNVRAGLLRTCFNVPVGLGRGTTGSLQRVYRQPIRQAAMQCACTETCETPKRVMLCSAPLQPHLAPMTPPAQPTCAASIRSTIPSRAWASGQNASCDCAARHSESLPCFWLSWLAGHNKLFLNDGAKRVVLGALLTLFLDIEAHHLLDLLLPRLGWAQCDRI